MCVRHQESELTSHGAFMPWSNTHASKAWPTIACNSVILRTPCHVREILHKRVQTLQLHLYEGLEPAKLIPREEDCGCLSGSIVPGKGLYCERGLDET